MCKCPRERTASGDRQVNRILNVGLYGLFRHCGGDSYTRYPGAVDRMDLALRARELL